MNERTQLAVGLRFLLASLLKIGYGIVLAGMTIVLTWAFGYISDGNGLSILIGSAYVVFYVLLVPALIMLICNRRVSKALLVVGLAWVIVAILVVFVLGYGFLKDSSGAHCTGFFGVQTSCASNQYFLVLILLFNPYSILVWLILSLLGLLKGWYDYFEDRSIARGRK